MVEHVSDLEPDIIVLTGDYLCPSHLSDPVSARHFRQFVSQLYAPYGIYAVRGSAEPHLFQMEDLFGGTGVVWLEQETVVVAVGGQRLTLVGVACSHEQEVDVGRLQATMQGVPRNAFALLLFHSPDLILEAAGHSIDLYLGGHTHGGLIRVPFFGAIFAGSMYGRRYASGLFHEGSTAMYVSR